METGALKIRAGAIPVALQGGCYLLTASKNVWVGTCFIRRRRSPGGMLDIQELTDAIKHSCLVFMISLIALAGPAMASGTVTPGNIVWTGGTCCGQNQPQFIHNPAALVNYFQTTPPPNTWPGAYTNCSSKPAQGGLTCYVFAWGVNIPYTSQSACPANSTGWPASNPTTCTCNDNYRPDAAGTSCVSDCPIPPLTPLTDPVAIDFENGNRWRPDGLTADYQSRLTCVQNGITNQGGTYVGTSAYRPTQYQQHLFEVVDKHRELTFPGYMDAHSECQSLLNTVNAQMEAHGLRSGQLVATPGTSRHESGTAFDITPSGLTDAQLTSVYSGCGVTHTAVPGEPWHVQ